MFCFHCKEELPVANFSVISQRKWLCGLIRKSRCKKCSTQVRKAQLPYFEAKLARATSPKKIEKLRKHVEYLRYVRVTKPRMQSAKSRARRLQARPSWVRPEWFVGIYDEAARISKETGVEHHVDHVVPLQGKKVSGLDVPWNLQILTAGENIRKSNKFDC